MQSRVEVQVFTVAGCGCKTGTCGPQPDDVVEMVRGLLAGHFGVQVPVRNVNVLSPDVFSYPQVIAAIRARAHRVPVVAINGVPYMSERVDGDRLVRVVAQALAS